MLFNIFNKLRAVKKIKFSFLFFFILFFAIFFAGVFTFSIILPVNMVSALSGNYSKTPSSSITYSEWNSLPNDFVDKQGGAMAGPLSLPGDPTQPLQAATKQYVDSIISGAAGGALISDISGNALKIVCGRTTPGATAWQQYNPGGQLNELQLDIDTSAAGFAATPVYITSLGGAADHYNSIGATSIYSATPTSFSVFIISGPTFDVNITPAQANDALHRWYLNWCGIGN